MKAPIDASVPGGRDSSPSLGSTQYLCLLISGPGTKPRSIARARPPTVQLFVTRGNELLRRKERGGCGDPRRRRPESWTCYPQTAVPLTPDPTPYACRVGPVGRLGLMPPFLSRGQYKMPALTIRCQTIRIAWAMRLWFVSHKHL